MAQRNPSKITTSYEVDDAIEQTAGFEFDADDRQYLDNQIRGTQQRVVDLNAKEFAIVSYDIDWRSGGVQTKTLGAGAQAFTLSNALDGQVIIVIVTGSASTLTWTTPVLWPGGVAPTQTASGTDVYTLVKAGGVFYGTVVQDMS